MNPDASMILSDSCGPNVDSSQRSSIEPGKLRKSASKIPRNSPIEPGIPGFQWFFSMHSPHFSLSRILCWFEWFPISH
jgi:hypothetical protein